MNVAQKEQRREERRAAAGRVHVRFRDPRPISIDGWLIDISTHGFRMAHNFSSLAAGQIVEFSHPETAGRAQVMWNRILDGGMETGFRIVAES